MFGERERARLADARVACIAVANTGSIKSLALMIISLAKRTKKDAYRHHHVCAADVDATIMAQGVNCWNSVTAAPP